MSKDLKPCPFCGGEGAIAYDGGMLVPICKDCNVSMGEYDSTEFEGTPSESTERAKRAAERAWNNQTVRRQNEKLREGLQFYAEDGTKAQQILEEVDNG